MNERPLDMAEVARDDELLDLLGSGLPPESTDPAIRALYTWRLELCEGLEDLEQPSAEVNGHPRPDESTSDDAGSAPTLNGRVGPRTATRSTAEGTAGRHRRRPGRRRATVAAAAVGLSAGLSGVAVAAADAQPGSPLWPITRVIYSDTAADRQAAADAEAALDRAREALKDGRTADAKRFLDEANRQAGAVRSGRADKLRADLNQVRSQIEQKQTGRPTPELSATPDPDESTDSSPTPAPDTPSTSPTSGTRDKGKGDPGRNRDSEAEEPGLISPDTTSGGDLSTAL